MDLTTINTSKMHTNTYIAVNDGKAFVVDAGGGAEQIAQIIRDKGAVLDAILITHAHFDHIGGVAELLRIAPREEGKDITVFMHKDDSDKISSFKNLGFAVGVKVEPFTPDVLLKGGETITVAGVKVDVIHTPGHSDGGVCYVVEDKIFSGDTLFLCSYGRTDFYDGSFAKIKNSIVNKLFRLQGDYAVLPGHGDPSRLDFERKNNPVIYTKAEGGILAD